MTKHSRVKEIETPYGRKVVQDNNAYEIQMPLAGSLGQRILRVSMIADLGPRIFIE